MRSAILSGMHRWVSLLPVAAGLLCLAACRSDPVARPSPLPPGYSEAVRTGAAKPSRRGTRARGKREDEQLLDGVIASVGDKFLTRREVLRRLRLSQSDPLSDTDRDAEIDEERVRWATQQLLVKAARQSGIAIQASRLEEYANDRLEDHIREASEDAGRPLTRDEYLSEKRLTWEEFTSQKHDEFMAALYMAKLRDGVQGTRPIIDRSVSPGEVRRIYRENKEQFDIKAGAKIALFQFSTSGVDDGKHSLAECEALVTRRAEQLADLFRQGHPAKRLARHYSLDDEKLGSWIVRPGVEPREALSKIAADGFEHWMLDPARQVRDTYIVKDPGGPIVVGIVELESARVLPFSEAHDKIVDRIRHGMNLHLQARLISDMIGRGAVVSPPELEDLLLDSAQETLDIIASDPILKSARLQ